MPLCLSSLVNVNCECYPRGNSRSRKTSLSLTRHCLSRVRERERGAAAARRGRWWTKEAEEAEEAWQSEEASVILLPSRALTLSVRPGPRPAQLLVESFTTGAAAPVDVVRSPTDRPTPPPLLAQFAPHRRFIASHDHNVVENSAGQTDISLLPQSSSSKPSSFFSHLLPPAPQREAWLVLLVG